MVITAVRYFAVWILATLVAMPVACALVVLLPFRVARIRVLNWSGQMIAAAVLWLLGARATLDGRGELDVSGPAIYVANHSSALDTVIIPWIGVNRSTFVLKREAMRVPIIGQALWMSGHVFIDRSSPQKAMTTLNRLAQFAKDNRLGIWIMPEGTRTKTGKLGRFKKGFVRLALETGYPVVPIVIHGASEIWPNGTWRLRPGPLHIRVLAPVDTSTWTTETGQEHALFIRGLIADELNK